MGKKHIILFIFILVLLIILLKNNEYFNILGGDVYAIKNYDSCDDNYEAVSLMSGDSKLCIKKREKGNNGIRNIEKDTNGNVFSSIDDNSGYKFYIPSKSKYIGCIKKNKHDKDFNNSTKSEVDKNFEDCSSSSGDFFGMSIPEFNNQDNYAKNIFTDKKLNCYNFNNKIPNLKESIVDDYHCDKIRTSDNKFLGGLGYISLYQKENKYQGLNFNAGIIKRDNLFTFKDIEEIRNNMFFWYKSQDDKNNPIIRSGIGDGNGNFTKIQKGFNNQKTYILRDYSGNSNIAELKHIKGLGTYIIKIKLNQFNSRTDSDNQIIVSEIKSYFTTRSLDYITNNNLECEEEKKNKKKKKKILGFRMEDDYGEIGGYKYLENPYNDKEQYPTNSISESICEYNNINIYEKTHNRDFGKIWDNKKERENKFCPVIELKRMKLADNQVQLQDLQEDFTLNMKFKLNRDIKNYQVAPLFSFIVHNSVVKEKNHKVLWSIHAKKPLYKEKINPDTKTDPEMNKLGLLYRGMKVKRIRFIKKKDSSTFEDKNYFYLNFGLRTIDDEHIDLVKGGKVEYFKESEKYKEYSNINFSAPTPTDTDNDTDTNIYVYTNGIYDKPRLHADNAGSDYIITFSDSRSLLPGLYGKTYQNRGFAKGKAMNLYVVADTSYGLKSPFIPGFELGEASDWRPYRKNRNPGTPNRDYFFDINHINYKNKRSKPYKLVSNDYRLYINYHKDGESKQGFPVETAYDGYISNQSGGIGDFELYQLHDKSDTFSNNYSFRIQHGNIVLGANNYYSQETPHIKNYQTYVFYKPPNAWDRNKIFKYKEINDSDMLLSPDFPSDKFDKLPPFRDVNILNIFENTDDNEENYLFPVKFNDSIEDRVDSDDDGGKDSYGRRAGQMQSTTEGSSTTKKEIKGLRSRKNNGEKKFPHYYHNLRERWYPKYPEVKEYVFAIGDLFDPDNSNNDKEYFVDIILKEPIEAHKVFVHDISDDGTTVQGVTVQLWDDSNTTNPTFEYELIKNKFQNVPIVIYKPTNVEIKKDTYYEVELNCKDKNKVKIYVNNETNKTEFTVEKDSLNLDPNKNSDKNMTGYFQIGGDLSSSTPMILEELKLFKNKIHPYLNTDTESDGKKGLKRIHKNILSEVLKKENNLLGEKKYQLIPSDVTNPTRIGSLGNYFLIFHKKTKRYLNHKTLNIGTINDRNINEFIWGIQNDNLGDTLIQEDKQFYFITDKQIKKLLTGTTVYKLEKRNRSMDNTNKDIFYYEDIFFLNREDNLVTFNSGSLKSISNQYENYDNATFQLHPIPNKYKSKGNPKSKVYSCNYKALDKDCEVENNIIGYNFDSVKHDNDKNILYGKKDGKYYYCNKPCSDVGDWKLSTPEQGINNDSYRKLNNEELNTNYKNPNNKIDYDDYILDNRKLLFYEDNDYVKNKELSREANLLKVTKLNSSDGLTLNENGNLITNLNFNLGFIKPPNIYTSCDSSYPQPKDLKSYESPS